MPNLSPETDAFIAELDAAVEAHMNWTHRILRFAVLHTAPGEDVFSPIAHTLCRFGCWFASQREHFDVLDAQATQHIESSHQAMHNAIRTICTDIQAGRAGKNADLETFERAQSELLGLIASFKTLLLSNAIRHDPLTGLALRYGVENDFAHYLKDAQRNHSLLYVVMIDVDHWQTSDQPRNQGSTVQRRNHGNQKRYRGSHQGTRRVEGQVSRLPEWQGGNGPV